MPEANRIEGDLALRKLTELMPYQEIANKALVAFITSLARDNIPPDIQELLVLGDSDKVKPKALNRAITAALTEISRGERIFISLQPIRCICPARSNKTCKRNDCPRKELK
jgi:hypothetical protein